MNNLVYVIGVSPGKISEITALLSDHWQVKRVTRAELMTALVRRKPCAIVIIESDLDLDSLTTIDSTLGLEYVPTICVSYNRQTDHVLHTIRDATYINAKGLGVVLPALVGQGACFAKRYNDLHVSHDTYEIMNEEVGASLEVYIDKRLKYSESGMSHYYDIVYKNNMFLNKVPSMIWLLKSLGNNHFNASLYDLKAATVNKQFDFYDEIFCFQTYAETGFIKNQGSELSDISNISELIPVEVLKESPSINNVACFANNNVMLIAMDFNGKISQSDLNILKALTIKTDLMVNIKGKMNELEAAFIYTMNALARAAEGKDDVTGYHIKRVNMYSKFIAELLNKDSDFIDQIEVAAQMHDVGKILIPDEILNKPGKLTEEEYELIKSHTIYGVKVIGESDHLIMANRIARYHHEKYDGSGYPEGLRAQSIPIEARIVALADVYDALRSPRPYKPGFTHEKACNIIIQGDGRVEPSHFDPKILAIFSNNHEAFNHIYESLKDKE